MVSLDDKPLEAVNEGDLQALIDNQVREGKTIDYKVSLPGNTDSDKKEFLADVSSFANATGGHLLLGIKEESGLPVGISGLQGINADAEILRLENTIRSGIEPRIPGVSIRALPIENSGVVIMIRVPRSWASPHRISFQEWSRFYSRNSAGKYPLDISELRAAFVLSETTAERIRNFRIERLGKIITGESPVPLGSSGKLVIHIVPLAFLDAAIQFNLSQIANDMIITQSSWGGHRRYNLDGYLIFENDNSSASYLQIFRNGNIEAACSRITFSSRGDSLISDNLEGKVLHELRDLLTIQRKLRVEPPLFVMVSLLGVLGHFMYFPQWELYNEPTRRIDRNDLVMPEILIEDFNCDLAEAMRPVFYAIWNAAGWPKSLNYDENGKFIVK